MCGDGFVSPSDLFLKFEEAAPRNRRPSRKRKGYANGKAAFPHIRQHSRKESVFTILNSMKQSIAHIALVVADYDEAIAFYTEKLGFEIIEDTPQSETKRWVLVAPKDSQCQLLLAKGVDDEQKSRIGNQTGGRVFLFLQTDDFWRDYQDFRARGVRFVREPKTEDYGTVAVFADLYGNLWDLIEFAK
jgi:catechol 2,3-dioxygenase-like lactoylglutathione lyase family enzyme